jgi:hypothetical protein
MTNWNYWEAVRRFQRVLEVSGVSATLRAQGIRVGGVGRAGHVLLVGTAGHTGNPTMYSIAM